MRNSEKLNNLKETDTYSLVLFALYKLIDIPEYSALSELIYVLDKNNLLNLCEFFGGTTIRIPTIEELQNLVQALMLYQSVNIDKLEYDEAVESLGIESCELRDIKKSYKHICDVLENYSFIDRG